MPNNVSAPTKKASIQKMAVQAVLSTFAAKGIDRMTETRAEEVLAACALTAHY
jgi:hypothetical protein